MGTVLDKLQNAQGKKGAHGHGSKAIGSPKLSASKCLLRIVPVPAYKSSRILLQFFSRVECRG
jgi:hypothetical protein